MAKRKYLLDNDTSKELMFRWNGGWRSTEIYWNQEQIATIGKNEVLNGVNIDLPDNSKLEVKLEKGMFATLITKRNGNHIPNSMGDPQYMLRQIFILLLVLGIINIGIGLAIAFLTKDSDMIQLGYLNTAIGGVQILLGYGILKAFFPALILATILMGADMVLMAIFSGGSATSGGVFMKLFFLIFMLRGFKAFKERKRIETEAL